MGLIVDIIWISFSFVVGPSSDSSGINMIDSIKVYCKTKENFGWPEDANEAATQGTDQTPETRPVTRSTETSGHIDISRTEP